MNQSMLTTISIYKGWGFILVTAVLLHWLIQRYSEAVRAGERQLHLLTDSLPALIAYVDAGRHYRFDNKAYERWFGQRASGKHMREVLGTEAYEAISEYVDLALAGQPVSYEAEVPYRVGGPKFVGATYIPDPGTDGRIRGFFALVQDISERREAEEELRQWADAFQHCAHGIVIDIPITGRILVCNPAFALMLGSRADDIVDSSILSTYAPSDHEYIRGNIEKADEIGHASYQAHMIRRDGSIFPVQMDVVSVRGDDGDLLYRVVTVQDITERKRAEEELRKSEERYHYLFENNPHPMWVYDLKTLAFFDVNEAAVAKYGFSRREFLNMTIADIRPPEDLGKLMDNLAKPRQPLEHSEGWRHRLKNGTIIHVEITSHTIQTDGRASALVVAQDITERKRAEEALQRSEARYRALFDHMSEGFFQAELILDDSGKAADFRFVDVNPAHSRIIGMQREQVVGRKASELFPGLEESWFDAIAKVVHTGEPLYVEGFVQTNGRYYANSYFSPGPGQFASVFSDITERRQAEGQIRRLNDELEQRVSERTVQLEAANKELEAFSYSVSHDLRAPLRAIDGYTRILVEDHAQALDEEGKRACAIISREAQRMGELIDDLLAFSRLSRREIRKSRIDMKALAKTVFKEQAAGEGETRIDFKIGRLPSAVGDPALIRQVWTNLLANAVKFTSGRKRAIIEAGATEEKDETVYYVRDNGAGFDMEYAEKLFGVFQRLHSESEFEGTGVGLAIVKRVIQRHGGRVWAEGAVDRGAVFYFALPR